MARGARQLVVGELYLTAPKPELESVLGEAVRRERPPKRQKQEDGRPLEQGCRKSPVRVHWREPVVNPRCQSARRFALQLPCSLKARLFTAVVLFFSSFNSARSVPVQCPMQCPFSARCSAHSVSSEDFEKCGA